VEATRLLKPLVQRAFKRLGEQAGRNVSERCAGPEKGNAGADPPEIRGRPKLMEIETKTRVCKLPEEKFDFLGYTFGQCYSPKTGRAYLGTVPSRKRVKRVCETINELTGRHQLLLDQEIVVARLNRVLTGWANYFCLGPVSKAYQAVDHHACPTAMC
jgi:hypothetical protein